MNHLSDYFPRHVSPINQIDVLSVSRPQVCNNTWLQLRSKFHRDKETELTLSACWDLRVFVDACVLSNIARTYIVIEGHLDYPSLFEPIRACLSLSETIRAYLSLFEPT